MDKEKKLSLSILILLVFTLSLIISSFVLYTQINISKQKIVCDSVDYYKIDIERDILGNVVSVKTDNPNVNCEVER